MNAIKTGAMAVGGLALFAGSFIGVAAMRGDSMGEVPIVGPLFESASDEDVDVGGGRIASMSPDAGPASVAGDGGAGGERVATGSEGPTRRAPSVNQTALVQRASLPLRSFLLESPFSAAQLEELELQLEAKLNEEQRLLLELAERERKLEVREQHVADRWRELEQMKSLLVQRENELTELEGEMRRDREAAQQREAKSWADLAALFTEGDASDLAPKLLTMEPEDAALVLRELQTDRVSELLNQLKQEDYERYVDAYRRAGISADGQ